MSDRKVPDFKFYFDGRCTECLAGIHEMHRPDCVSQWEAPHDGLKLHGPNAAPDGGGVRADEPHKLMRYDLIPGEMLDALALHYGKGGQKIEKITGQCGDRNWERGMSWGKCFGAAMRHAWAFWRGERIGSMGEHPLIAAIWNLTALYVYDMRKIGADDRGPKTPSLF